jgi:hypothetical protein
VGLLNCSIPYTAWWLLLCVHVMATWERGFTGTVSAGYKIYNDILTHKSNVLGWEVKFWTKMLSILSTWQIQILPKLQMWTCTAREQVSWRQERGNSVHCSFLTVTVILPSIYHSHPTSRHIIHGTYILGVCTSGSIWRHPVGLKPATLPTARWSLVLGLIPVP